MTKAGLFAVGVVALVLVAGAPAGGAGDAAGLGQERVDPDRVVLGVALQPDGDARWTVEYRVRLATENDTAAFEELRADVRANATRYENDFAARFGRTAANAANATGREMAIENVTVTAEQTAIPREYGVVTYRFRWTGFAAVDGESVRAGDALAGLFLDDGTTLRMSWPSGYATSTVRPGADQRDAGEVVWRGPREFGPSEPTVVVVPEQQQTTTVPATANSRAGVWVGVLAVLAVLGVAGFAVVRRRRGGAVGAGADESDVNGDGGNDGGSDGPPSELLSNEERVRELLAANDGRLKQQAVADRLDWTAAKTSQVVGKMREAGTVETFRLGRENVVTLPDRGLDGDVEFGEDSL